MFALRSNSSEQLGMQMGDRKKPATIVRPQLSVRNENRMELALLAEFMAHDSVAALARAIARRLGGEARAADLLAAANVGAGLD